MKLSDMIPLDQTIEDARAADPEFRKLWDETAFARAVATEVTRYRADNGLTQAELGRLIGMTQPAVATLESGEVTPTLKTLTKVTAATGLTFHLAVAHGAVELAAA